MAEPQQGELELEPGEPTTEPVVVEETEPVEEPVEVTDPKPDPLATAQSELQIEREQRIRLEERLNAQSAEAAAKPAKQEVKRLTRAELRVAVNEGKLDDDQMEEFWANQQREVHNEDTEKIVRAHAKQESEADFVVTQTQQYLQNFPDVAKEGSPTWNKVKREYDYLRSVGDDDSKTTELKALRAALGSSTRIKEHTQALRETVNETSSNVSSGGESTPDIFSKMPTKYRNYNRERYKNGQVTLETLEKELPYMKDLEKRPSEPMH